MTLNLRIKVAIGVWLMCILSLIESSHLEPVIGWWDWLVVAWAFGKVGLSGYAGFLLITADEEIENLRASKESSERLIEEESEFSEDLLRRRLKRTDGTRRRP